MSITLVADVALVVLAVGWILFKQVQPAPVKPRLLVIVPVVLGYFGATTTTAKTWSNGPDLLFIVLGVAISLGLGLPRGATIRVWAAEDGRWWRQGTKATLALWGALFVARAGLYIVAEATGHQAASGVGPLLFALAISFAAQNVVIATRMRPGAGPTPASYPSAEAPPRSRSDDPSVTGPFRPNRAPVYADGHSEGSLHERAVQRRAERRARRAARREDW
jgi:hypothetical protein